MCRRNLLFASVLIAFGAGVLLSLLIESVLFRLILGGAAVAAGLFLLKNRTCFVC